MTRTTRTKDKGKAAIGRPPASKPAATGPRWSGTGEPREGSRQARLVILLRGLEGAKISDITEAFGWQAHTARAVISTLGKRLGTKVEAERKEGVLVYRLPPA